MGYATKLIFYIIPLILLMVVVVIFFGQEGAWEDLKDTISDTKDFAPDLSIGDDELSGEFVTPAHHKTKIEELSKLINDTMLNSANKNCFVKGPVFDDLKVDKEITSFSYVRMPGEKSKLVVKSGAGGKQVDTTLLHEFENMIPCVIAGKSDEAEHFVEGFFEGGNILQPYYKPVSSVTFSYKFGKATSDGNGISVADYNDEPINDEGDNMENNGWMFTPDGKHICFFPTNDAVNADDDGIDNDFFDNLQNVKICSPPSKPQQTASQTKTPSKWYYCNDKCTSKKTDCGTSSIVEKDSIQACQSLISTKGRVIFVPVNWNGQGMAAPLKTQFETYSELFKVKKEFKPLAGKNCQINEFLTQGFNQQVVQDKLFSCAKTFTSTLTSDDIVVGVFNNLKTLRQAFNNPTMTAVTSGEAIYMYPSHDKYDFAHEVGHLKYNYCDEYAYADLRTKEESEVIPLKGKTFDQWVESEFDSWKKDIPSVTKKSNGNQVIINGKYKGDDYETILTPQGSSVHRLDKISYIYGWSRQNQKKTCVNQYATCCADHPNYNPGNLGVNCAPPSIFSDIDDLCIGGPCKNPTSSECRSIMGPAGKPIPRGLPQ